jgi:hypothetical protein
MPINRIRLDDVDIRNITTTTTLINQTLDSLADTVEENYDTLLATFNSGLATKASLESPTFTGNVVAGSSLVTNEVIENFTTNTTTPTGTLNIDFANSGIHNFTTTTAANWTFNFRASSTVSLNSYLLIGQAATVTILLSNGATPYRATAFQIDGISVTPRWADALAPAAGNANSTDIYTFTILKTANNTFIVLGSLARFA